MKTIKRDAYLAELSGSMHNGCVKIVTGVRRCGKSYLLGVLFAGLLRKSGVAKSRIVKVALDLAEFEELQNPRNLLKYVTGRIGKNKGMHYVFIDEIQLAYKVRKAGVSPAEVAEEDIDSTWLTFYDVLNSLNAMPNVDVYVTGSNSKMLSDDIVTNFRGRRTEIRMGPLTFSEFHAFKGGDKSDDWCEYMTYGGLPQVVLAPDGTAKRKILKELFDNVYLKDVVERNKIPDPDLLECVVRVLSSSVGSLTNPTKLANTLRSIDKNSPSGPTVRKYLSFLVSAYLFRHALRYDVRGRRYLDYPSKYYAVDVGLRNSCLEFREQEQAHLMENLIFNELKARGCEVDVGVVEMWHAKDGERRLRQHEIDFVANTGTAKVYVQSAFSMDDPGQSARELLPLSNTGDSFRKIVVTAGNTPPWTDNSGVLHVGVIPFMLDPGILKSIL